MAFDPSDEWTDGGGYYFFNHMCDPSGCAADFAIHVTIVLTIKILYNWISNGYILLRCGWKTTANVAQWKSDLELTDVNYNLHITALYTDPSKLSLY